MRSRPRRRAIHPPASPVVAVIPTKGEPMAHLQTPLDGNAATGPTADGRVISIAASNGHPGVDAR